MARNPVFKSKDSYISGYQIENYMNENGLTIPFSFPFAFRVGKRKKIKSFHVRGRGSCKCCGRAFYVTFNGNSFDVY